MTILSRNDQKGRSMVEMLGVLAIIGVLSVGGISGYSKAMGKFKLTKAQDQISMTLMNIRTAFASSPTYASLDDKIVRDLGLAPSEMIGAGGASGLINAFGGKASVGSCAAGGSECGVTDFASSYFFIMFEGLTKEVCVSLATSDWGSEGLYGIKVGDADIVLATTGILPIPIANAIEDNACGKKGNLNKIRWVFY